MKQSFLPKLAFDYLNEIEQSNDCFESKRSLSDKELEILHSFFGEHFILATELLEKCRLIEYRLENNFRSIFKIVTNKEQYTIFDNINFCQCNVFRLQVLESKNAITCKHVLAVKLGKIIGNTILENVTGSQLVDFLNEQLNFIEVKHE